MAENTYSYSGDNVKDYSQSITDQYDKLVKNQNSAVDKTVKDGESRLGLISDAGANAANQNVQQAQQDLQDAYRTRDSIEQNNGNRQGIGHTQYGQNEISYDQQRANIAAQQAQLEKDITRQVADLRSQGEYEKADAALQTAQEKFQQLYTDALRRDTNLRSNYEYITGLQREDQQIQRNQETADKEFSQQMGELMMSKGIMPEDSMLTAMGIDQSTAQLYINAVKSAMYSSGGSGGSGSGGSSKSSSGTGDYDYSGTGTGTQEASTGGSTTSGWQGGKAYNNSIAKQVFNLAASGSWSQAQNVLGKAYAAGQFSPQNVQSVYNIAQKKYFSYVNNTYKNRASSTTSSKSSTTSKSNTSSKSSTTNKKSTSTGTLAKKATSAIK